MNTIRIKHYIGIAWGVLSVYMLVDGVLIFRKTSGLVVGSDFSMLITLVNQLSLFTVWLALFALWRLVPNGESNPAHNPQP